MSENSIPRTASDLLASHDVRHQPSFSQRDAIQAAAQPLLVVAGPGAGKTFCLIERIRYVIEHHRVAPNRIVAFTFTNKAAEEIASRLDQLGPASRQVRRTTIHKFCVDVLREHGTAINVDPGFGIADEDYQFALLRQLGSSDKNHRSLIQAFARHRLRGDDLSISEARRFERYESELRQRRMLDFDQLLLKTADALAHAKAADVIRGRYDVILVDEFQDLNPVQYSIIRTLAERTRNVFAVGDYDQSIYGWAGAEPKLFESYMNDFGIVKPVYLLENHRTAREIFQLARRFVDINPALPGFGERPDIATTRESEHPVEVFAFENAEDEAAWLIGDLRRHREQHGLAWGDFGVLYRTHEIGNLLEPALLTAGIPCRLAHGRAVGEDPIIAYVVACLGVMTHPGDAAYQERFLQMVLPRTLTDWARTEAERRGEGLLGPLRRQLNSKGANWEEIRRAVTALKNIGAFLRRHDQLPALFDELLSRRVGKYRNALAERHLELDDPETIPEASALAFRINSVLNNQRPLVLPRLGGAEIPIKAMLHEIGIRTVVIPSADDVPVRSASPVIPSASEGSAAIAGGSSPARNDIADLSDVRSARTVFKALQILTARKFAGTFRDFTTIDIESTGLDIKRCEIVEIAAVRVRDGRIVDEYHSLVKPRIPIEPGATMVHTIDEAKVANAPYFEQVWPAFRDFCGDDILVAHNGEDFDFPVIRRMAEGLPGANTMATYDSMPLAHEITPTSKKLENLARDFGIDPGRAHGALDDSRTLALVFARLNREKVTRSRKSCLLQLLDHLGVALALSQLPEGHPERFAGHSERIGHSERSEESRGPLRDDPSANDARVLLDIARPFALGAFSDALEYYRSNRDAAGDASLPTADDVITRLGGHELMERIRRQKTAEERYPSSMQRLRLLTAGTEGSPIADQIATFLERVALSGREAGDEDVGRVNLLTLHATKGLEFSHVYIVGAEDEQFSREKDSREQVEENRRTFYVGMTRAKDRLVLTRCVTRNGKLTGGTRFLDELGITPRTPAASAGAAKESATPAPRQAGS